MDFFSFGKGNKKSSLEEAHGIKQIPEEKMLEWSEHVVIATHKALLDLGEPVEAFDCTSFHVLQNEKQEQDFLELIFKVCGISSIFEKNRIALSLAEQIKLYCPVCDFAEKVDTLDAFSPMYPEVQTILHECGCRILFGDKVSAVFVGFNPIGLKLALSFIEEHRKKLGKSCPPLMPMRLEF